MKRKSDRVLPWVVLTGALCVTATAAAALKGKAPKDVKLTGTTWKLDDRASDDPQEVIERAAQAERAERDRRASDASNRDVFGDRRGGSPTDGPFGGGSDSGGTWGGGTDRNSRRDSMPSDPLDPNTRGGGWGRTTGRTSTDIDPTGQSSTATVQYGGGAGGIRNEFVGQLTVSPDTLAFLQVNDSLKVTADRLETDCAAGSKEPLSDSFGDGELACGWDGRAWVIETKRGKRFTRTDRYELSRDGKSLTYVTSASGQNMPRIRIARTYRVAPPNPPAP